MTAPGLGALQQILFVDVFSAWLLALSQYAFIIRCLLSGFDWTFLYWGA